MKSTTLLLLLTASFSSFANCIDGLTDKSVLYCSGSNVFVSTVGGEVLGPVTLKSISSANKGIIQVPGTDYTRVVIPSLALAVDNGCTPRKNVCVGHVVNDNNTGVDFKIVGRFEGGYLAGAACLNSDCDKYALDGAVSIIRELNEESVRIQ